MSSHPGSHSDPQDGEAAVLWLRTWPEESQPCKCPAEKAGSSGWGGTLLSLSAAPPLPLSLSLPLPPLPSPSASQRWQPLQMETPGCTGRLLTAVASHLLTYS